MMQLAHAPLERYEPAAHVVVVDEVQKLAPIAEVKPG